MGKVNVIVVDATGNKEQKVGLPDDIKCGIIMVKLVEKIKLPSVGPDGNPISYKFVHKVTGRQLLEAQTLGEAGIKDGDVLRLQPEITAGAFCYRCGGVLEPGMSFCSKCGAKIEMSNGKKFCTTCGNEMQIGSEFCSRCGSSNRAVNVEPINPMINEYNIGKVKKSNSDFIVWAIFVVLQFALYFADGFFKVNLSILRDSGFSADTGLSFAKLAKASGSEYSLILAILPSLIIFGFSLLRRNKQRKGLGVLNVFVGLSNSAMLFIAALICNDNYGKYIFTDNNVVVRELSEPSTIFFIELLIHFVMFIMLIVNVKHNFIKSKNIKY